MNHAASVLFVSGTFSQKQFETYLVPDWMEYILSMISSIV